MGKVEICYFSGPIANTKSWILFFQKCLLNRYLHFTWPFFLILYFDWLLGPHKGQNFEKHLIIFSSETVWGMKPVLCIYVPDGSLYIICVFYFSQIRNLVVMATWSFHGLIMRKVEIGYFSGSIADIWILFLQKSLSSSPLHFMWLLQLKLFRHSITMAHPFSH